MSWDRIVAIMYRHVKPTLRDGMRLVDMFYWPLLDIVLWGFSSLWLGTQPNHTATTMMLCSLTLWQVIFRSSIEVTRSLLEEIWHQNFTNLFAAPLRLSEWTIAILSISMVNALWNFLFSALASHVIFGVNIFQVGFSLLPFFFVLVMFGWFCGLISSSVILLLGRRVEMFAWTFPWVFAAFSCVFYPISVLPASVQRISWCLPTTYIFESTRNLVTTGQLNLHFLLTALVLATIFLVGGMSLLWFAFRRARNVGLNSLV